MRSPLIVAGSLLSLAMALNCGSSEPDCAATLTCPKRDGGAGDGGVDAPAGCDANADPKDAPACVVEGFGVFVDAAGGDDANAGTKAAPFKTIGGALGKLGGASRVYVCEGTYAEHVKVTTPASIYGGFACGEWSYSGVKAKVAPADEDVALALEGVNGVVVADLTVEAKAGTAAKPSSIAATAMESSVTFRRVEMTAGEGFAGASPAKAAEGALASSTPEPGTLDGDDASGSFGGLAQFCTCVGGGNSKGGGGGNVGAPGGPGEAVQAVPDPPTATGAGQSSTECQIGTDLARPGSNAPGAPAATGAAAVGELVAGIWTPKSGSRGAFGTSGQGGGGGGGNGGGGGGGGCGGCGGAGGEPGDGGGASIALVASDSTITFSDSRLGARAGGLGGTGGAGGDGLPGGTRGVGSGGACNGGNGGRGGNGGAGGGGAGGISVGVLFKGPAPILEGTTITTGAAGAKGIGGAPGVNDGIDGIKADTLEAP